MTMLLPAAVALLAIALVVALVALFVVLRRGAGGAIEEEFAALTDRIDDMGEAHARAQERLERGLRSDLTETARASRAEAGSGFAQFQQTLAAQLAGMATVQNAQ